MEEKKESTEFVPKKTWTKGQAVTVMVVGGLMLLLSIVIPTEPDSTAHTVKVIVGMLGVCVICLGAYLRPGKGPKKMKQ